MIFLIENIKFKNKKGKLQSKKWMNDILKSKTNFFQIIQDNEDNNI